MISRASGNPDSYNFLSHKIFNRTSNNLKAKIFLWVSENIYSYNCREHASDFFFEIH